MNVPVVPCRACRQPVSIHAKACPGCGQPMGTTGANKHIAIVLVVLGMAFVAWRIFGH